MTDTNNAAQPVLTDEEIQDIADGFDIYGAKPEFARAIESAALLSKLRAPVSDIREGFELTYGADADDPACASDLRHFTNGWRACIMSQVRAPVADDLVTSLRSMASVAPASECEILLAAANALASAPVAGEAVTDEMIQAGAKAAREYFERTGGNSPAVIYRAMRAAAPAAPPQAITISATPEQIDEILRVMKAAPPGRLDLLPQASEAVPTEPMRVFAAGMWTYDGTGQAFSHTEMDGAAFATYRAALPAPQAAENIRAGMPYDDPAFKALCREHGIWGTAEAALCAVFWRQAGQQRADATDWSAIAAEAQVERDAARAERDALIVERQQRAAGDERTAFEATYQADYDDPGAACEREHFGKGYRAGLLAARHHDDSQKASEPEPKRFVILKESGSRFAYVNDTELGRTVKRFDVLNGDGWGKAERLATRLNAQHDSAGLAAQSAKKEQNDAN